MYSRILIAVDGSPTSGHALRHAIGLAKGLSAALRVVHVVDMGVLPLGPELAIDIGAITKARRAAGEQVLNTARATCRAAGIEAEMRLVETGAPAQRIAAAIADEAAAWPADLVVAGTHGRSGVQRLLLGSVAEGIARVLPVPVLLIPLHGTTSSAP
ncbi:MAG TPA: universal stress protein [Acidiferrobacterales bacterium]|nr:universal stress protein [Acidiferrobacterales bacterium]